MGRVAFRVDKGKRSLCARADVNVDNYVTSEAEHNHYGNPPEKPVHA